MLLSPAMTSVSLLMIGSEILDARIAESNSQYLISELSAAGVPVEHVLCCTDSMPAIARSLNFVLGSSGIVIVSGGLGPTTDDITREAIASFCDLKLVLHGDVLGRLEAYFHARKRPFDPSNCKQALFPEGATTIDNPVGSALGFALRFERRSESKLIFSLPGVPAELRAMSNATVLPLIRRESKALVPLERRALRVFGLAESAIGSRVQQSEPDPSVLIAYRAHFPEIEVIFKGTQKSTLDSTIKRARQEIGADHIFSEELEDSMQSVLHRMLTKRKLTIAVAESCTGGLLGSLLTENAGSSNYFLGGAITYSNDLKIDFLGVRKKALRKHGAVSDAAAQAMAAGVKKISGSDIGISVTGIAGPGGGSAAKPVGTFYVGIAHGKAVNSYRFFLHSSRKMIRLYAAWMALDVVRRTLLKIPVHSHAYAEPVRPRRGGGT